MIRSYDLILENGASTPASYPTCQTVLSDEQLLERCRTGQKDALEELFCRYEAAAYRVAFKRLGNPDDALDIVQESFARAFTQLDRFEGRSSLKTWLLRIVYNAALNEGRKRSRRQRLLERTALARSTEQVRTPSCNMVEQEEEARATALQKTILCIVESAEPEMQQVLMRLIQGWTFAQIAEELGCCEKTARTIRKRLRALVLRELAVLGSSVG